MLKLAIARVMWPRNWGSGQTPKLDSVSRVKHVNFTRASREDSFTNVCKPIRPIRQPFHPTRLIIYKLAADQRTAVISKEAIRRFTEAEKCLFLTERD